MFSRYLPALLLAAALAALAASGAPAHARSDAGVIFAYRTQSSDALLAVDPIAGSQTAINIGYIHFALPAVTRDGTTVAFGANGLRIADVRIPQASIIPGTTQNTHTPAWSPDGSQLVVTDIGPEGDTWDLYTMDIDGSDKRLIVDTAGTTDFADWSPDGSRIAYIETSGPSDPSQIWVASADGSVQNVITTEGANWYPDWSPDSSQIAYASIRNGVSAIYVMNADGGNNHPLLPDRQCVGPTQSPTQPLLCTGDDWPSWSPDGSQIAFESGGNILVANADGSGLHQVTNTGDLLYPDWVEKALVNSTPKPTKPPKTPTISPSPKPTTLTIVTATPRPSGPRTSGTKSPPPTPVGGPAASATTRPSFSNVPTFGAVPFATDTPDGGPFADSDQPEDDGGGGGSSRTVGAIAGTALVLMGLPALAVFAIRRFTS